MIKPFFPRVLLLRTAEVLSALEWEMFLLQIRVYALLGQLVYLGNSPGIV